MKFLKRISIFVSMVLACVMAKAADYEIKAADISVVEGGTTTLAIELKNAGEVVGFQCDISLPEGVKLSGEMTMLRHQEGVHILVKKEQSDGSMRVLVYSNPNTPFTGNEGVVLNVPLSVEASIGSYSIGLKNPVITAPGAVAHYADASTVTLTVKPKYIDANAVTLNKSSLELLIGGTEQLIATVSPDNATDKTVVWTSSDNSVATVDANGNVTAVALGSATITASCGSVKAECKVTVLPIAATAVTLNKSSLELLVGGTEQLIATVSPDNATDKTVVWTSSDNSVATVDANGNVTAVALGSATITASCGSVKAECKVTVLPIAVSELTLNKTEMKIFVGGSSQLAATISPDNATNKTIVWTSSDNSIATVDANGNVQAIAVGTAIITASCDSVKAECKVTIIKRSQTITWNQKFNNIKEGDVIELTATSSSGLEIVYTVLEGDAVIQGNTLTLNAPGQVRVEASQPGNDEYNAARTVVKKITVLPIPASEVSLNKAELELLIGGTEQLIATVSPDNASDKTVVWTSSDSNVATVDENGLVQAIAAGNVVITASCGEVKAECKVTVLKKQQTITWDQAFDDVTEGNIIELNAIASSGLDVVYKVIEGDAVIEGKFLTINTSGKISIEASQPGDNEFYSAQPVVRTFNVTSGIFDIKSESKKAIYYDIKGRVVKNPKNGVYIVNGRKVFIK